jgi:hypothetical protein
MTSIPKTNVERANDAARDVDTSQLDFFGPTPEDLAELDAIRAEAHAKAAQAAAIAAMTPEERKKADEQKKKEEWREDWKKTRDLKAAPDSVEMLELRKLHDATQVDLRVAKRQIKDLESELAKIREELALATAKQGAVKIIGRHYQATIEVDVIPRHVVGLEIDCGCLKHSRPFSFQVAITKSGNAYVRATERGDGRFAHSAHAGPIMTRIDSSRAVEDPASTSAPDDATSDPPTTTGAS